MNKYWSWINAHESSNGFLNREGERGRKIYKEETMQKGKKERSLRSLITHCD